MRLKKRRTSQLKGNIWPLWVWPLSMRCAPQAAASSAPSQSPAPQPNGTPNPSAPTTRRAIRDEFYKVIRICGQNDQVYDAVTDPTEQNDLWTPTLGTGVAQIDVSYNFLDCELRKTYLCPGETACSLPLKKRFISRVSSASSRWWPRAILLQPRRSAAV